MPSNTSLKFDLKPLEQLQENLKESYTAKIGILKGQSSRGSDNSGITNAEIGALHEFGSLTNKIPRRSFLYDSILEKKKELTKQLGALIKKYAPEKNGAKKIYELLGITAEGYILESFETQGFGKWQPLSEKTTKAKNKKGLSPNILQATLQLKGSISSKAEKLK